MGNQVAKEAVRLDPSKPVVFIVGGGYGGIAAAKVLDDSDEFNVVLFDRKDYFSHTVGLPRVLSDPDWHEKVIIPYTNLLRNGRVVKAYVENIGDDSIKIQGHDEQYKFDYLVIATGSAYALPKYIPTGTAAEARELFAKTYTAVEKARRITVAGGGPVAIELVGEIVDKYPRGKEITIVASGSQLLSGPQNLNPGLRSHMEKIVKEAGVNLILNTRAELPTNEDGSRFTLGPLKVRTDAGEEIESDLVIDATGVKLNTGALSSFQFNDQGRLTVNKALQVKGHKNIFAIGDVAGTDAQMGFIATKHGQIAGANVIALHKSAKLKEWGGFPTVMMVPFGKYRGGVHTPVSWFGNWLASITKGRDYFVGMTWRDLTLQLGNGEVEESSQIRDQSIANMSNALGLDNASGVEISTKGFEIDEKKLRTAKHL